MTVLKRMSPLTALFIGVFGVGAVGIAAAAGIVLYGMRIVDTKAAHLVELAGGTIESLPDLIRSLPPAVSELLNDRRAPEYAKLIDVNVRLIPDQRSGELRPVLAVRNTGNEVVSMLAVRVAVLNEETIPVSEWTEVVATPIALDTGWRGPLFPGDVRYVVMSRQRCIQVAASPETSVTAATEISEIRLWQPPTARVASADAGG